MSIVFDLCRSVQDLFCVSNDSNDVQRFCWNVSWLCYVDSFDREVNCSAVSVFGCATPQTNTCSRYTNFQIRCNALVERNASLCTFMKACRLSQRMSYLVVKSD